MMPRSFHVDLDRRSYLWCSFCGERLKNDGAGVPPHDCSEDKRRALRSRNEGIMADRLAGRSVGLIARGVGLSSGRVRQIITNQKRAAERKAHHSRFRTFARSCKYLVTKK